MEKARSGGNGRESRKGRTFVGLVTCRVSMPHGKSWSFYRILKDVESPRK